MRLEQWCRQWFSEDIDNLVFCLHMSCPDFSIVNFFTNSMTIQLNVFGPFMINWVGCNVECYLVVIKQGGRLIVLHLEIM